MKPSAYNFIWPAEDDDKAIVFNGITTSLVEVGKEHINLLNIPRFDYNNLSISAKQFVDGLKYGGFVLDDESNELRLLKVNFDGKKYDRSIMSLTIAPTLLCNFNCPYCYEQSKEGQQRRDGYNALMPDFIQKELLSFIERESSSLKGVSIMWYGGEPLLGKEIIFNLSEKIIAFTRENKLKYSASMVSNGYLLAGSSTDLVQMLKDSQINSFQITLDGPPEIHNRRRMLKADQGPTFDRIIEGIKILLDNDIRVSVRINIDHTNMKEAIKLLDFLEINKLLDINIELGQVTAKTAGCKSIENSCTTTEEFALFKQSFHEALKERGFKTFQSKLYPGNPSPCCASQINSFVIDPDGDMYKCWEEIGEKHSRIGNIIGFRKRGPNERTHEIRWLSWEPFENSQCLCCKILPICMGGCSFQAITTNNGKPDCVGWKYRLEHYVRERYNHEKNKKAVETQR